VGQTDVAGWSVQLIGFLYAKFPKALVEPHPIMAHPATIQQINYFFCFDFIG
jgi:hypothetical protein